MSGFHVGDRYEFNSVGRKSAHEIQVAQTLKLPGLGFSPVPIVPTGLIITRSPSAVLDDRGATTGGSFPPNSTKKGGHAEALQLPAGGVRGRVTGQQFVQNDKTRSLERALEEISEAKQKNGDKPFRFIVIDAHGGPAIVFLGNGEIKRVGDIVAELVAADLIGNGGSLC
jgi:hypothetical protein